jgi:long-chain acyl-CoA synthetase
MDAIESIEERIKENADSPAFFWQGKEFSYGKFHTYIEEWIGRLAHQGIEAGTVCGIKGDYSPQVASLFFALMKVGAIMIPFAGAKDREITSLGEVAGVQHLFHFDDADNWTMEDVDCGPQNELIEKFRAHARPGLIVFTSGSTGKPKGILHDCERVMRKFSTRRTARRVVLFLMIDHFGGLNTLFSTIAYGGMAVCLPNRAPDIVCRVIEESRASLLPTTPTFLNILIASGSYRACDLSSIELITYGTEVMPAATLEKVNRIFPNATVKQTYGLSELGVLRSKSEGDGSLWVKLGGQGFDVKIVKNVLWVRAESNMVGYLNAPNPFDEEGWLCTGDQVELKGDYVRFLGRQSEVINVGGEKVYPVEVENVLLEAENVTHATVFGVKHPLMGQVIHAHVSLNHPQDPIGLAESLRKFCLGKMVRFKVPVRFHIVPESEHHNIRYKKNRKSCQNVEE